MAATDPARLQIPAIARRRRITRLVVLVVLVIGGGVGLYFALRTTAAPPKFRFVRVEKRDVLQVVEATGKVDVQSRQAVHATVASYLIDVSVNPGDHVKRGDLLARLDDRQASIEKLRSNAAVRAARASERGALTKLTEARQNLATKQNLREQGLASQADVQAAQAAVNQAEAALAAARAEREAAASTVAAAELGQELTEIRAPTDGVVLTAPENLGETVSPQGPPLFVLADSLDQMVITASVDEADIGMVKVGQPATFEVRAHPGRKFKATVHRIGLEPIQGERLVSYPVTLRAENPEGELMRGMTASVAIEIGRHVGVLAVREAALRFVPEGAPTAPARSVVWRKVTARKIEPVNVEAGLSDGTYTEVAPVPPDEIAEGDDIAVGLARARGRSTQGPSLKLGGS